MTSEEIVITSSEEEGEQCENCAGIIEEDTDETSCSCRLCENCREHNQRNIKAIGCSICEIPFCDNCASLRRKMDGFVLEIKRLKQEINELKKQLNK